MTCQGYSCYYSTSELDAAGVPRLVCTLPPKALIIAEKPACCRDYDYQCRSYIYEPGTDPQEISEC